MNIFSEPFPRHSDSFKPLLLLQAHPHLSGFLLGLRLLRLLWRSNRGPGARSCHHVLAQWEMGLHWRALRFIALCPQEVCYQGDLRWPESVLLVVLWHFSPGCVPVRYTTMSVSQVSSISDWMMWVMHILVKREDLLFPFSFPGLVFITQQCLCNSVKEQRTVTDLFSLVTQGDSLHNTISKPRNLFQCTKHVLRLCKGNHVIS